MSVNAGFPVVVPSNPDNDGHIDDLGTVACGQCKQTVPAGKAHIVCSPVGPDLHVMFCPEHCPCAQTS